MAPSEVIVLFVIVVIFVTTMPEVDGWPEVAKITKGVHFHIIEDSMDIYVDAVEEIYDVNTVKDVFVVFEDFQYIEYIELIVVGNVETVLVGEPGQKTVVKEKNKCLKFGDTRYNCKVVCSAMSLVNVSAKITRLEFYGYDVNAYNFLGCFERYHFEHLKTRPNIKGCEETCSTTYYAITDDERCICLIRTPDMSTVDLENCKVCPNRPFLMCGSNNYISIYSKYKTQNIPRINYTEYGACVRYALQCPDCEKGRKGKFCNHIDCSEPPYPCGNKDCINFDFDIHKDDNTKLGTCLCKGGFFMDRHLECIDVDECDLGGPCDFFNGTCYNNHGSFTCDCGLGWRKVASGNCEDIDECTGNRNCIGEKCNFTMACDAETSTCVNMLGDFECVCKEGFTKLYPTRHSTCKVTQVSTFDTVKYVLISSALIVIFLIFVAGVVIQAVLRKE